MLGNLVKKSIEKQQKGPTQKEIMQRAGQDTNGEWTKNVKYDSDSGDLTVEFQNGHTEVYPNIDQEKADRIIDGTQMKTGNRSDSVGAAIWEELL